MLKIVVILFLKNIFMHITTIATLAKSKYLSILKYTTNGH